MKPEMVAVDAAFIIEQLRGSEGWRLFLKNIREKKQERIDALVKSASPLDSPRIAGLQAEIRLLEWIVESSLDEIESSSVKKEAK